MMCNDAFQAISVLVIENDSQSAGMIKRYLASRSEHIFADVARGDSEARLKLELKHYDLIFLNIQIPGISKVLDHEEVKSTGSLIFLSSNSRYAISAFDLGAIDYLIIPFSRNRFNQALDRSIQFIRKAKLDIDTVRHHGYSFKSRDNHYFLAFHDILYFSSKAKQTIVHTVYTDFDISVILKYIEQELTGNGFMRIHKQYIVNLNHVLRLRILGEKRYRVHLKDGKRTELPVGRKYIGDLKRLLQPVFNSA